MRIAVTGASGVLGRHAVAQLLEAGHEVHAIDRARSAGRLCPSIVADVRDFAQMCRALHGCDAVLHLAALITPIGYQQDEVFAINALGTFNVLQAASLTKMRVVYASSASALGVAYATQPFPLRYVPVDEEHPALPQDSYGLSKLVGEEICRAHFRRTGNPAVSLRLPLIWDSEGSPCLLDQLAGDERAARHTLWSYIHVRDAARACLRALEKPGLGDEVLYAAAPRTFMAEASARLARRHFPTLEEIRGDEEGHWSFHDCSRATRLLGFVAEHIYT